MNWRMKLRLQIMGTIISIVGLGLIATRGAAIQFDAFLALGLVLLVLGVLWKKPAPASST